MGHQVIMRSELAIMDWLLSDPPGHEVGHVELHSTLSNGQGIQVKLYEVAQMPMVPTPVTLPSLWGVMGSALQSVDREEHS